jgi:hypothetical protein
MPPRIGECGLLASPSLYGDLLCGYRPIVEAMVAVKTSIHSLAAQRQNEAQALQEIVALDTGNRLVLTFRTHVLPRHAADAEVESGDSKRHTGMTSGRNTMNGRLPLRERAGLGLEREPGRAGRKSIRGSAGRPDEEKLAAVCGYYNASAIGK